MSIPDRLFKISKTYLSQVRDRIDAELTERTDALRELDTGSDKNSRVDESDTDSLMRRAEERVAAARRDLEARRAGETSGTVPSPTTSAMPTTGDAALSGDPNAMDFRILGIPVGSDFAAVQDAYQKLAARCDVRRFPDGSAEQTDAARILERVNTSYDNLRQKLDPMQKRFGKLELE